MKKRLLNMLAAGAVFMVCVFAGGTALAAGAGRLPEALVATAEELAEDHDVRFLVYDVNGDGKSELAALYCEDGMILYSRLFGVDGAGNAQEIFSNGGELLAGSPGCYMVELPFEGADRLAYYYHNFGGVAYEQYTIFVPGPDGTIGTRSLQAEVDVAGDVGYSLYWQDGAGIDAEQFYAVHDNAVILSAIDAEGQTVTLERLLADYGPVSAEEEEQSQQTAQDREPSAESLVTEKNTRITDLGANIDEPDIVLWRSSRVVYTYGDRDELVREELYYDGELSTVTDYRYDADGRAGGCAETWDDGQAWTVYGYDEAGRKIGEVRSVGPEDAYEPPLYCWKYTYDEEGRKVREEYRVANSVDLDTFDVIEPGETADVSWSEDFYYNDAGELESSYAEDGISYYWRYYDGHGNLVTEEYYSAKDDGGPYRVVNCENTYDDAGRLLRTVESLSDGELLGEITYTYGDGTEWEAPEEDSGDGNYDLLRSYWMENVGLDCCGVFGDVDRDGQDDFIYVEDHGDASEVWGYVLTVKNGAVRSVQVEDGVPVHAGGYVNLFVRVNDDGTADLIDYVDGMYQGYGQCCFTVYHLDGDGNRVETDQLVISDNGGMPPSQEQWEQFGRDGEALLDGTTCLYTSGLEGVVSLGNVLFPQTTAELFDMGLD